MTYAFSFACFAVAAWSAFMGIRGFGRVAAQGLQVHWTEVAFVCAMPMNTGIPFAFGLGAFLQL